MFKGYSPAGEAWAVPKVFKGSNPSREVIDIVQNIQKVSMIPVDIFFINLRLNISVEIS